MAAHCSRKSAASASESDDISEENEGSKGDEMTLEVFWMMNFNLKLVPLFLLGC